MIEWGTRVELQLKLDLRGIPNPAAQRGNPFSSKKRTGWPPFLTKNDPTPQSHQPHQNVHTHQGKRFVKGPIRRAET